MGLMSKYVIEVYALSGVVVRANDFRKDLRLVGYSYYSRIEFNVVVGIKALPLLEIPFTRAKYTSSITTFSRVNLMLCRVEVQWRYLSSNRA